MPPPPRLRCYLRQDITAKAIMEALQGDGESIAITTDEGHMLFKGEAMSHVGLLITLSNGAHLVTGKNVSAFTDSEERVVQLDDVVPFLLASKLEQRGAHHHAAPDWTAKVVVDGRLITGQNPQSASGVGAALRDALLAP